MGRAEERQRLKKQKKNFKKQGMTDENYADFMKKVDEKYYNDVVRAAYKDVYDVFFKELENVMVQNRISKDRARKILQTAMENCRGVKLTYVKVAEDSRCEII